MTPWVTATMSGETPTRMLSRLPCSVRKAKISAPKAIPTGLLRPSSATAMPAKPMPGLERRAVVVGVAEQRRHADQAGDGAGEEHRDDDHLLDVRRRSPPRRVSEAPEARRSKPNRVRFSSTQNSDTRRRRRAATARRAWWGCRRRCVMPPTQLPSSIVLVLRALPVLCADAWSGSSRPASRAIAFSMIVEITSLTPRVVAQDAGDAGPQGAGQHGDQDRRRRC